MNTFQASEPLDLPSPHRGWGRAARAWQHAVEAASIPRCLIGASAFRVLAGMTILYQTLINYAQRQFLFGPQGIYPYAEFLTRPRGFSIYSLSPDLWYFEFVFHVGLIVAGLWTLGVWTRLMTPLTYVTWFSLHQRNQLLWDGGDNVMQLVLLYACLMQAGTYCSVQTPRPDTRSPTRSAVDGMLHNAGLVAMVIQICLVYEVAGLAKASGASWRNGTALYYALRASEFYLPGVSDRIYSSDTVIALLCHTTVLFQIGFPFFVFLSQTARRLAVLVAISFHVAIASVMGLVTFAMFMMAVDLALISDVEYRAVGEIIARIGNWRAWAKRSLGSRMRPRSSQLTSNHHL